MGKTLGPENGIDRRTDPGHVSSGTLRESRISPGYHSRTYRCPRRQESTGVLVGGWSVLLSMSCSWRFVNWNAKFHPTTEFTPARPLFVHYDVGTSRMVSNQVTDLLREIKYRTHETTHFEPQHIQYLPVRSKLMEIIETQVTETNGDLVAFAKGQTLLTLHFKKG